MALSGRPGRDGSHPRSTTLFPNVSPVSARTRSRAEYRGRGDISLDICSACTYIRRRLIESKGRGRYKVCRPPRHKTHALPVERCRTSRGRRVRVLTFILSPSIHPRCPRANNLGTGDATTSPRTVTPNLYIRVCRACWRNARDNCALLCLDRYYFQISLFDTFQSFWIVVENGEYEEIMDTYSVVHDLLRIRGCESLFLFPLLHKQLLTLYTPLSSVTTH